MRTIKFRCWLSDAKNTTNEQMQYSGVPSSGDWMKFWRNHNGWCGSIKKLMQFTGLLDKSGHEIYEGDLIRHHGYPSIGKLLPVVCITEIHGGFGLKRSNGNYIYLCPQNEIEVCDNIYKNSNLVQ